MGGIANSLSYQQVDSYYDLYLNNETSRYVFRILAFKVIYENTERYGFLLDDEDLYAPLSYRTLTIDSSINNLAAFATEQQTNYKMLKVYNPWLRKSTLTVKQGESYSLRLPPIAANNQ